MSTNNLNLSEIKSVKLVGDWNGWNIKTGMKLNETDVLGIYSLERGMNETGVREFKVVINDEWAPASIGFGDNLGIILSNNSKNVTFLFEAERIYRIIVDLGNSNICLLPQEISYPINDLRNFRNTYIRSTLGKKLFTPLSECQAIKKELLHIGIELDDPGIQKEIIPTLEKLIEVEELVKRFTGENGIFGLNKVIPKEKVQEIKADTISRIMNHSSDFVIDAKRNSLRVRTELGNNIAKVEPSNIIKSIVLYYILTRATQQEVKNIFEIMDEVYWLIGEKVMVKYGIKKM